MLKVSAGDMPAFEQAGAALSGSPGWFLLHLIHDRTACEDLAQEAFFARTNPANVTSRPLLFDTGFPDCRTILPAIRKAGRRGGGKSLSEAIRAMTIFVHRNKSLQIGRHSCQRRQLDSREMQDVVRNAVEELTEGQRTAVLAQVRRNELRRNRRNHGLGTVAVKSLLSRACGNSRNHLRNSCSIWLTRP